MTESREKVVYCIVSILLLLACMTTCSACELEAGVGKQIDARGLSEGVASIGCRWRHKIDVQLNWIGESRIYDGQVVIPAFATLNISRVWEFKRRWFGTPELLAGLTLKSADRCARAEETECNRKLPLPVNFHWGGGVAWAAWRIQFFHDSNDALDWGPEKKNLGLNWARLEYRFR